MNFCNSEHPLNNCAIKVQSKEHGKKVIEFWKSQGVNTGLLDGCVLGGYYGLFDGRFDWKDTLCGDEKIFLLEEKPSIDLTKGWVVECKDEEESRKVANFIKGSDRAWSFYPYAINHLGILDSNFKDSNLWHYIPPGAKHLPILTFKQFEQLILNNANNNMDNRFPFKLNEEQAKRIIKIACPTDWQPKLIKEWSKDLLLQGYVAVSEELYREGRKASNNTQNALLDEIFGKDKEEFKVGDVVITKNYNDKYDGRPLKIIKIDKVFQKQYCYFEVLDGGYYCNTHNFRIERILRIATQEEIDRALCPYEDGELCLVKNLGEWYLRYATGKVDRNGKPTFYFDQKKLGGFASCWAHHKSAKGLNLD